MQNAKLKIVYENDDVLVVDKPAGIIVFPEGKNKPVTTNNWCEDKEKTLIDLLLKDNPALKNAGERPRYGIVHRLDKDTSGILLVAKNNKSLIFFQKQFKDKRVEKKYIALAAGKVKAEQGLIETLIGRALKDRKKQKAYLPAEPGARGKRKAITEYKVIERFTQLNSCKANLTGLKDYTLLEVFPKTGRKHQIRCHFSYLGHPIAGDKMYGFKNQPCPRELKRQFLHASYLKIKSPNGKEKEFKSKLPNDLKNILEKLRYSPG